MISPADIASTATELQAVLDAHCRSVDAACDPVPGVQTRCRSHRELRRVVAEAIEAIEATRRAFKSRQLESVRRKLIRALADCE